MKTLDILKLTQYQKYEGIWIRGDDINGEFKEWHHEGTLFSHSVYINGIEEHKVWNAVGHLCEHFVADYEGTIIKDYLK